MSLLTLMESVGTLKRPNIGRDSAHGTTQTFDIIAANVTCSVQPLTMQDRDLYGQTNTEINMMIFTLLNIGARNNDRFEVEELDSNGQPTGVVNTYLVRGFQTPVSRYRFWYMPAEQLQ